MPFLRSSDQLVAQRAHFENYYNKERTLRVSQNRVLRGIFESVIEDVTGDWRRLHIEELHNLYSSSNIASMIKSRHMRSEGHVA
jgi:hypothetical protein